MVYAVFKSPFPFSAFATGSACCDKDMERVEVKKAPKGGMVVVLSAIVVAAR